MHCDICGLETTCPVTIETVSARRPAWPAAKVCPACLTYRTLRALSATEVRPALDLEPVA